MKFLFKLLLNIFFIMNMLAFCFVMYHKPSKCAYTLESPFKYAEKVTYTRLEYYFLGGLLTGVYTGAYIALYLNEKPKECSGR